VRSSRWDALGRAGTRWDDAALGDASSGGRAAVVRPPRWDRPRDGRGREALGPTARWKRKVRGRGRGREEEGGEESNRVEEEGESAALKSGRPWKRTTLFARRRWKRKRRVRAARRVAVEKRKRNRLGCRPLAALQWWRRTGMDWEWSSGDCRPPPCRRRNGLGHWDLDAYRLHCYLNRLIDLLTISQYSATTAQLKV
jgi:hypothetical protein